MNIKKESAMEKRAVMVLWVVLALEFTLLAAANLFLQLERIDDDSAKLYVHIMEMWKNRNIFIPGWSYSTTVEIDCASLLALPLYALTGNIFLSFGISNIVFMFLFVWVLFQVFRGKSRIYPLLSAIMLLIPYKTGMLEYVNMLFFNGSQYIMKVMLPLMLAAILIRAEDGSRKLEKDKVALWALYGVFLFVTSLSSGAYVFACGLFPVFAGFFAYKILSGGKISSSYWICGAVTLVLTVAGMAICQAMQVGTNGTTMNLLGIGSRMLFLENFYLVFLGIFELFKGNAYEDVPVLSLQGIDIVIRIVYILLILACAFRSAMKAAKGRENATGSMLSAVLVWNLFILIICNTRNGAPLFANRYHLMGMVPAICLAVEKFTDLFLGGGTSVAAFPGRRRTDCGFGGVLRT